MAQTDQNEGIKAFISSRILTGHLPESEAEAALELLGTLGPDSTVAGEVPPELEPASEFEPVTMSPSWVRTHR